MDNCIIIFYSCSLCDKKNDNIMKFYVCRICAKFICEKCFLNHICFDD